MPKYDVKFWKHCTTADRMCITVEADSPEEARAKVLAWGTGEGELSEEEEATESVEKEEVQDSEFDSLVSECYPNAVTLVSDR